LARWRAPHHALERPATRDAADLHPSADGPSGMLGRVKALLTPGASLALAIAVEILATIALKYSEGLSRLVPSVLSLAGYALSLLLLARALLAIPVSTAYAVWSGVGTAAVAAIGMALLGEPVSAMKIVAIVLVVAGVVMLNLSGAH
jgi:small multidrug resistance pump